MKRTAILILLLLTGVGSVAGADRQAVVPLSVLYVGDSKSPRAVDYESFLKKYFRQVRVANREGFDPATAKSADVVLLDWSQSDADVRKAKSPFGKLEDWNRPTVLLGSAGLLLAGQWQIIGGAG